jgi:hypothetical protein
MSPRASWMSVKYGLMVHYLPSALESCDGSISNPSPEEVEDLLDVDLFMRDFDASGAEWLIFTLGQNTGFYNSPNAVIGSGHCLKRDIVKEIATAVFASRGLSPCGKVCHVWAGDMPDSHPMDSSLRIPSQKRADISFGASCLRLTPIGGIVAVSIGTRR